MISFSPRLLGIALWCAAGLTHSAPVPGQGIWEFTLQARDIDGNGSTDAFYDSALNVTWMADWNSSGLVEFEDALDWAAGLTVAGLGGWRLPGMTDTGAPGCVSPLDHGTDCGFNSDTSTSELAHMFYVTLGNLGRVAPGNDLDDPPPFGWGLSNTADFAGIQQYRYWTGTPNGPGQAWLFDMRLGQQVPNTGLYDGYPAVRAVAVRDGDVMGQAVPVSLPSSGALAALGLLLTLAPWRSAAAARR